MRCNQCLNLKNLMRSLLAVEWRDLLQVICMAKEGLEVLLVERGNFPGSKNMTGGRLYSHSLEKIIPDFAKEAPVQRKIIHEKISMMTEDSAVTIDYSSEKLGVQGKDSYTVIRSEFDQWLAEKAEEVGAQIISGILSGRPDC